MTESTGELIDSEKYQEMAKHSSHYYDYDRNGKLNKVEIDNDSFGQKPWDESMLEKTDCGKVELRAELEAKKKKNFQSVAIACMAEYSRTYGEMPEDELWMFLEAEYYGTGEGQTVCLQMTQANPRGGDDGDFDRTLPYPDDYKPINTKQYRAVRGFHKLFGTFFLHGLRFHTREAFFTRYANQLPSSLVKLKDQRCMLEYHSELHYNFA